jgi:septal ring factor EnvC (AmiA/AmiB activator)
VPELPTPDDDPITSKSFALYYAVATVVLTASLFWALWDEAYGQRPWKTTQEVFQQRYTAFLKTTRKKASQSQKDVEASPDYQKLEQQYKQASEQARQQINQLNEKISDLSAQILAVQNVFTDKRGDLRDRDRRRLVFQAQQATRPEQVGTATVHGGVSRRQPEEI